MIRTLVGFQPEEVQIPESKLPVADIVGEPDHNLGQISLPGPSSNPGSFQSRPIESLEDWICPSCSTPNFSFRNICKSCNFKKPGNGSQQSQEVFSPQKVGWMSNISNEAPSDVKKWRHLSQMKNVTFCCAENIFELLKTWQAFIWDK